MNEKCDLFIFSGEPSGDLHGEKIFRALKEERPNLTIQGIGGPRMREAGLDCFLPMEEFQVMGFVDVLSSLPRLYRLFQKIRSKILEIGPKGVLFIDYPGFNLRMARSLKRSKSPSKLIHFVCPTVWAWGKRRIPLMEKNLDKLLTILPFEPSLFSKQRLDVEYVGHPLISRMHSHEYDSNWRRHYQISESEILLTIFPGSRQKELERNFHLQLKAAQTLLKERKDMTLAVSSSSDAFLPFLKKMTHDQIKIIPPKHLYELMRSTHLAIATSGTVTLELALHRVPTIVTYAITSLDTFLATKAFRIKLPYYALPNIIANKEVFPELFGPQLTEHSLTQRLREQAISQFKRSACIQGCDELQDKLGLKVTPREVALSVLNTLSDHK